MGKRGNLGNLWGKTGTGLANRIAMVRQGTRKAFSVVSTRASTAVHAAGSLPAVAVPSRRADRAAAASRMHSCGFAQ
jgi:hypothetical protein